MLANTSLHLKLNNALKNLFEILFNTNAQLEVVLEFLPKKCCLSIKVTISISFLDLTAFLITKCCHKNIQNIKYSSH